MPIQKGSSEAFRILQLSTSQNSSVGASEMPLGCHQGPQQPGSDERSNDNSTPTCLVMRHVNESTAEPSKLRPAGGGVSATAPLDMQHLCKSLVSPSSG